MNWAVKLGKLTRLPALLTMALVLSAAPVGAHEKKKHQQPATATQPATGGNAAMPIAAEPPRDDQMAGMMQEMEQERASMSPAERLLDWLGRLHPTIVHFPIAFFPAALFTAIVGRRRPAFATPVQFLVVAGGIIAPIAAILGWLNAIGADPDLLLTVHRWLGTAIGIVAIPLGILAWRKPDQVRGKGMIVALSVITAAIVVQGWYGGALVHGAEHLNW